MKSRTGVLRIGRVEVHPVAGIEKDEHPIICDRTQSYVGPWNSSCRGVCSEGRYLLWYAVLEYFDIVQCKFMNVPSLGVFDREIQFHLAYVGRECGDFPSACIGRLRIGEEAKR